MRTLLRPMIACAFFAAIGTQSVIAQQQTQAGVATNARNATVGTTSVSSGSTIFSGDLLKTGEQGRLQVQSGTIQFMFEASSAARIFRTGNRVIVELERGTVHYSAQGASEKLTLFAQDIKFIPAMSDLAVGQISIVSQCEVTATAKRSTLEATSGRETRTIETNKTYRVLSEVGVDYDDSWKPVPPDYSDYSRDADYHRSHRHVACSPDTWKQRTPHQPLKEGHFKYVAAGGVAAVTIVVLIKALESPSEP